MTIQEVRQETSPHNGLQQVIDRFQRSDFFLGLLEETRSAYAADVAQFQEYLRIQNISEVSKIELKDIINWRYQLKQAGKAPATINRKRASLSGFFNWAQAEGIIQPDFTIGFPKYESIRKRDRKTLSASQVDSLISKAKNLRDASLILIILATGAYITEILNLNAEDILITTNGNTIVRFKGDVRKNQPRVLQISKKAGDKIAEYIKGEKLKPEDPLFSGRRGKSRHGRLTREGVHLILKHYRKETEIDSLNPRMLWDTFMANFTGTPRERDKILGRRKKPKLARSTQFTHSPKEIIEI